jgi:hypothetical protein
MRPPTFGTQLGLQGLDRRTQPGQWFPFTVQALTRVAEHRLGLDGDRKDLSQCQLDFPRADPTAVWI